jgi:hypothetical protein
MSDYSWWRSSGLEASAGDEAGTVRRCRNKNVRPRELRVWMLRDAEPSFETERMTDHTVSLDQHRGMAAQKATETRRLLAEVEADERALRKRQEDLETQLAAAPAATWSEAAEKARYLLKLFATTPAAQDPRRQTLIGNVLGDLERLQIAGETANEAKP